ncbi:MAG: UDP-N-acetylmuramoyl-L-alanyl-D-glutamate--2,6-diaminopimelate ligase [Myxococcota bacterium]
MVVDHFGHDSREVGAGGLFVATRGTAWDGHQFIAGALERGAVAVVAEGPAPAELAPGVTWVGVADGQGMAALAHIAAAWYGHPGRDVKVLATTGTNGKTTITYLLRHILESVGAKVGLVSTVAIEIAGLRLPTIFTTPPAPQFQGLLAKMRDAGCGYAVVEASSHGLHQRRIAAFRVAVGGFTNLTRDHLDYHGTMAAYLDAKRILFAELADAACFNIDDPAGAELAAAFEGAKLTVSALGDRAADLHALAPQFDLDGIHSTIGVNTSSVRDSFSLSIPLIGSHNLQNALVAIGMAKLAGIDYPVAAEALRTAHGAPGRLQRVALDGVASPRVFVDYAHSPDALENVLRALRLVISDGADGGAGDAGTRPALVVVFGAGGDRDKAGGRRWPRSPLRASPTPRGERRTTRAPRTPRPHRRRHRGRHPGRSRLRARGRSAPRHRARHHRERARRRRALHRRQGHEDYQIIGTTKHPNSTTSPLRRRRWLPRRPRARASGGRPMIALTAKEIAHIVKGRVASGARTSSIRVSTRIAVRSHSPAPACPPAAPCSSR